MRQSQMQQRCRGVRTSGRVPPIPAVARLARPWSAETHGTEDRPATDRGPRRPPLTVALLLVATITLLTGLSACAGVATESDAKDTGTAPSPAASEPAGPELVPDDQVKLVISRDYGAEVMHDVLVEHSADLDVMKVLAGQVKVETAYGGGFVNAIDGVKSTFGSTGDPQDWFYWVDGLMAEVGALDYKLEGGDTIWWDYHLWQGSGFLPVVVQAFPQPWRAAPVTLVAGEGADAVATWAATQEIEVAERTSLEKKPAGTAIVAATAAEVATAPWLTDLLGPGADVGVFVAVDETGLTGLDQTGGMQGQREAALVGAPDPEDPKAAVLVLLGRDGAALDALTRQLPGGVPGEYVGVGLRNGDLVRLPVQDAGNE